MKLKKIKTVSVLEFVPPCPLMLVKRSKDLQYIDTPECPIPLPDGTFTPVKYFQYRRRKGDGGVKCV